MRPITSAVAVVALLASLALATSAQAVSPVKPWVAGYGSWSTYGMGDVNDQLVSSINADLLGGSGVSMDEVKNGFGFGVEAGLDVGQLVLGVGYERLAASTDVGVSGASLELNLPTNAFYGLAEFKLPTAGPMGVRLGVAGGIASLAGEFKISAPGFGSESVDLTGSGPLFKVYGTGEWGLGGQFGLLGSIGYRYAKVNEPELQGETVTDFEVDHSGVFFRAGLKFALLP